MEKIRLNYFRLLIIAIVIIAVDIFLLSHVDKSSGQMFLFLISAAALLTSSAFLVHKHKKSGLYFNSSGAFWIIGKTTVSKKWADITIEKKIDFSYFKLVYLNLDNQGKRSSLLLCWPSEYTLIDLTKKYVPENHEWYSIVKEYTKKRNLKF